ncbi:quinoprotein dehydrogenase-associated SoxYZ-like carrier [Ruegeria arenilitoris]|uniref:quinoprotein dehydrogenase-associated SoxYZ-like carrier n=1 Tax=Ruegeria arenilitoris TaxID=1173585 RepID=UPI00147EA5EF|nr:quinoprotein dehydrogenase-associated SoxYZ-like carrier [Ruegeria arenilitoris]
MKTSHMIAALLWMLAAPAWASGEAWENVRSLLYGDRPMQNGDALIAIDAPYRTPDDARAELAAQVIAPNGAKIARVTLVLDENPMPVSAVFALEEPLASFYFDVTMRVNGPTPLHVIAETTDGRLWVSETYVKTSGLGACAAPPGTDPELALATLGTMEAEVVGRVPALNTRSRLSNLGADRANKMDLNIDHPSHSGMQMDQISLLFIPMRYVETVDIDLDGAGYVELTGSISLSENPRVGISVPSRAQAVDVTMTDTDGTVTHLHKKLAGY